MSCSKCCQNPRIKDPCPKHTSHYLTLFCANQHCMEPMCIKCQQQHSQVHDQLGLGPVIIVELKEVENLTIQSAKKELEVIRNTKTKIHKPVEALDQCIDAFFYGSTQRRENMLAKRVKEIDDNKLNARILIDSIEKDHEYSMDAGFKQRYLAFLEQVVSQIKNKEQADLAKSRY